MIPKAFLFGSTSTQKSPGHHKKGDRGTTSAVDVFPSQDSGLHLPVTACAGSTNTSPVIIPPKRGQRVTSAQRELASDGHKSLRNSKSLSTSSSRVRGGRPLPNSIASVLEATAIPVPPRNKLSRNFRKLPQGNHVEDFSKLLMEGVKLRDDELINGQGNTLLDILLSPPEPIENSSMGNDYDVDTPSISSHSVSTESTPSLEHDLDSSSSAPLSSPPCSQRNASEKRRQRPSCSENCAFDHPLLEPELPEPLEPASQNRTLPDTNPRKSSLSVPFPRLGFTFKSNLTASLRAIKSAAQTVSAFATPPVQQDDFLTRSLFAITPKLTDDRRPPPMDEPPSPAMRRYLNPITISPAEMHIYNEHPPESEGLVCKCPVSIQMQTYRRSGGRGRKNGNFHLSSLDSSDLLFDPEIPPMARQREPRENSDFLRMVVLEMNMRRSGKLRDDIPPRAKIWLPPRKGGQHRLLSFNEYCDTDDENTVPARWIGVSVECA
ncbi:hypothetical protein PHISCL_07718 [Aspergillus sclerotialis]|uniref:Uncharacterized protein n=1 Tax=Aspergillus sclerotialis TaxID=2070753 RepID=A0A3A2ZF31_9EURO|nr:hypothetical protein PHISCL_07718 [Aspergillus sclerotialis]